VCGGVKHAAGKESLFYTGDNAMNLNFFAHTRRRLLVLTLAAVLALSASYAPVVLDSMASTALTNTAFACGAPGGGC
jgi:hypothetical protein